MFVNLVCFVDYVFLLFEEFYWIELIDVMVIFVKVGVLCNDVIFELLIFYFFVSERVIFGNLIDSVVLCFLIVGEVGESVWKGVVFLF